MRSGCTAIDEHAILSAEAPSEAPAPTPSEKILDLVLFACVNFMQQNFLFLINVNIVGSIIISLWLYEAGMSIAQSIAKASIQRRSLDSCASAIDC